MREGFYFGAGPAPLPTDVIKTAADEFIEYEKLGVGLGEMSHRSKQATEIINDTKAMIKQLWNVPDTHEILFVQGGGTGGFATVTYNMLAWYAKKTGKKGKADYLVTGSWSAKAVAEAKRLGVDANVVCDGKKNGSYTEIPDKSVWKFGDAKETAYVYYCDNETVHGVEFTEVPEVPEGVELVVDVSSNMLSKPVDFSKFAIVFGGAQKNVGIAGVSLYIVKKEILDQASVETLSGLGVPIAPSLLDLTLVAKNNSAYNTVSIFAIEVIKLVVKRLLEKGGIKAQQAESETKAKKLYDAIDARDLYIKKVSPSSRSRMNIVFNFADPDTEARFIEAAAERKLTGLKGHRSVGGIRVSNYNAVTPEAVDALVDLLNTFK